MCALCHTLPQNILLISNGKYQKYSGAGTNKVADVLHHIRPGDLRIIYAL